MKNQKMSPDHFKSMMDSLDSREAKLMQQIEEIREIKNAASILIKHNYITPMMEIKQVFQTRKAKVSPDANQSGKDTINQAQMTKKRIIKHLKSNGSSDFSNIQGSILKMNNSPYSKNTIRQYLYELKKTRKVKFDRSNKSYSI